MKLSRLLGLSTVAAVSVLLAACGSTEPGTPTQAGGSPSPGSISPSGPPPTGPDDSPGLAPPVDNPLDPELLISEPCDLFTETQRDQLGLTEGEINTTLTEDTGNNTCKWRTTAEDAMISISAEGSLDDGLNDVYAQREGTTYFEPVTINSYPAVFAANLGTPEDGNCQLYVGVTDHLTTRVFTRIPSTSEGDPCLLAQEAAEAMIDTLKD